MIATASFGKWMYRRRKALDLTQRDLAIRTGCALSTIKKIEADERRPSRDLANLLADALRIAPPWRATFVECARGLRPADELSPLEVGSEQRAAPVSAAPNLPAQVNPFIGRKADLAQIKTYLGNPDCRLLTLTGVGGSGKTRLALGVASTVLDDFADGVYFVDLAPFSESRLVAKAIAAVLGVVENSAESQLDTLKRVLAGRELLLVIDNFEHVIEAAPLIAELLASVPHLKVLATSREALRLSGEYEYLVPPLSLPSSDSPDAVVNSEAGTLFVQRARMLLPHFEITNDNAPAIAQICARLDGLPLAIELAAARCKLLSPQAMLARLDSRLTTLTGGSRDAPMRQQTLRRTLDWSFHLLDDGEKQLFARLAVFQGGRSLEAIEAVCQPGLPVDAFDALTALVDKNLIQSKPMPNGEPRFVMLETIHEYAREKLAESGEADIIHRRYADYFVELAERAEPELRLAEHAHWSQRLELELNNLRAVLDWSLGEGAVAHGLRLAGALSLFLWGYGSHIEGGGWIHPLLERLDEAPERYHAKFLFSAGLVAIMQYDLDTAKRLLMRTLDISRALEDRQFAAWALVYLGFAMLSETEKALVAAEEGLALFRELDHKPGIAQALNVVGNVATGLGDYVRAQRAYDECLTVARQTGETRQICHVFHNLAFLALRQGDYERAWSAACQAFDLSLTMNNRLLIVLSLTIFAGPLGLKGHPQRAARLLGASAAALEEMGAFYQPIDQPEIDSIIGNVRSQLDHATFQTAWAAGQSMTLEHAVAHAIESRATLNQRAVTSFSEPPPQQPLPYSLTERELEILRLLDRGLSTREVAQQLFLSVGTVRWYLKHIHSKFDVHSRSQALARARELRLLD